MVDFRVIRLELKHLLKMPDGLRLPAFRCQHITQTAVRPTKSGFRSIAF